MNQDRYESLDLTPYHEIRKKVEEAVNKFLKDGNYWRAYEYGKQILMESDCIAKFAEINSWPFSKAYEFVLKKLDIELSDAKDDMEVIGISA